MLSICFKVFKVSDVLGMDITISSAVHYAKMSIHRTLFAMGEVWFRHGMKTITNCFYCMLLRCKYQRVLSVAQLACMYVCISDELAICPEWILPLRNHY